MGDAAGGGETAADAVLGIDARSESNPGAFALARALLKTVVADPARLPENLAAFALGTLGPAVPADLARTRERYPDASTEQLADLEFRRGLRETISEGAMIGGPFVAFIPIAFCAALLAQIKMILRFAAVDGRDPTEPMRAAEVLVLLGVYPDVEVAGAALAKAALLRAAAERLEAAAAAESGAATAADASEPAADASRTAAVTPTPAKTSTRRALWVVVWRMARLLGLLTPDPENPRSRLARLGGWVLLIATFAVGVFLPLVWLPYLGYAYRGSTTELGARAGRFYFGAGRLARAEGRGRVSAGMSSAALRAVGSAVLTVGVVVFFLVFNVRLLGHTWVAVLAAVLGLSVLTGAIWWVRRSFGRARVAEG